MKQLFLLSISVILSFISATAQLTGPTTMTGAGGDFAQYLNKTLIKTSDNNKAAPLTAFNNTENTKGRRFMFDTWVSGDSVKDARGNLVNTTTYLFNFDKMTGNLLATEDKINNMSVAPSGIQSFVLKNNNRNYVFEHVDAIGPNKFYQALVKNDAGYSLYKQLFVTFKQADFRNDGIIQTGSTEDEYKDENRYYLVNSAKGMNKQVDLKAKSIKSVLATEKDKTDAYFKQHKDDVADESFLVGLVSYLNQ